MHSLAKRPLVWPVVVQHLEDAAFCWLRRNDALWLPLMHAEHLQRIDRQLDAHLCGLRIAGGAALPRALARLQRWKTADEMFASTYVALQLGTDPERFAPIEELLLADLELAHGAAAALLWAGPDVALPLMRRWWSSGQSVLRRAALPAALLHPQVKRDNVILDSIESDAPALVARGLRAIGEWRLVAHKPALEAALGTADPRCRLEAAYALRLLGHDVVVPSLPDYLEPLPMPTRRRLLLSTAATTSPARCEDVWQSLQQAGQGRDALWLQIFRGDPAALDHLAAALDGEYALLAAYGIEHITGVSLEDIGCWDKPDPMAPVPLKPKGRVEGESETAPAEDDPELRVHAEDSGLLPPQPERLRAWLALQPRPDGRHLGGVPVDAALVAGNAFSLSLPQRRQLAFERTRQGSAGAIDAVCAPLV